MRQVLPISQEGQANQQLAFAPAIGRTSGTRPEVERTPFNNRRKSAQKLRIPALPSSVITQAM
jgi:hypothetical protein